MIVALVNNFIVTSVLDVESITGDMVSANQLVVQIPDGDPMPSPGWELYGNKIQAVDTKRIDEEKYNKRASVKDSIIAWMAAENMKRYRAGIWTFADLSSLTMDQNLKLVLDDINTLSYELAMGKIDAVTNPLITTDIKTSWKMKLLANLF